MLVFFVLVVVVVVVVETDSSYVDNKRLHVEEIHMNTTLSGVKNLKIS